MIIYAYGILAFQLVALGIAINKENPMSTILSIIFYAPLIGRILGWW